MSPSRGALRRVCAISLAVVGCGLGLGAYVTGPTAAAQAHVVSAATSPTVAPTTEQQKPTATMGPSSATTSTASPTGSAIGDPSGSGADAQATRLRWVVGAGVLLLSLLVVAASLVIRQPPATSLRERDPWA